MNKKKKKIYTIDKLICPEQRLHNIEIENVFHWACDFV